LKLKLRRSFAAGSGWFKEHDVS